ncbi:MAG: class I SAM-dependent methyltransferase [Chloroflexota bacterium]
MDNETLKNQVKDYWNREACGTFLTDKDKYTREYFEEIEETRYKLQPEIFGFAQFPRFHGRTVLEIGIGAGTDFIQWTRCGCDSYGIDLTEEAVEHVNRRLSLYGLNATETRVADAENLPYDDNKFDLVYSWGVIHHSPQTLKALDEIVRVLKPGGSAKIMVYNRHSLLCYLFWIKHALLKFRPWKPLSWVLWNFMESPGTKAYTVGEMKKILGDRNLKNVKVVPLYSYYDKLGRFNWLFKKIAAGLTCILGRERIGWFLTFEFTKR